MEFTATLYQDTVGDGARVVALDALEALSAMSDASVTFWASNPDLDTGAMLWEEGLVAIAPSSGAAAFHFHGVVEEAEYLQPARDGHLYRLRLRPHLHALEYRVRSRIFQGKTADEILRAVITGAGVPAERVAFHTGTFAEREYCTQWKESELNFVARLCEDEGVFTWVEHTATGHVVHFGDDNGLFAAIDGDPTLPVARADGTRFRECVYEVALHARAGHDALTTRDHFWRTPTLMPEATVGAAGQRFEYYEYPGGFTDARTGRALAGARLAALRARGVGLRGKSSSLRLAPGRRFQLVEAHPAASVAEYTVVSARHAFRDPDFAADLSDGDGGPAWETAFEAIPADVEFRPERVARRPRAHGRETAVVTTPTGEEIHTDPAGRIKVHFYWDRENPIDDTASCWLRVQQLNTATSMILPRVGWEVEVGFLHGDPDRPVVLQKLYNASARPPYALPGNLQQSALQSSSTPGGGGTNEVRLNDASGGMEFFVHAQKDLDVMVGHNLTEEVTVDAAVQVTSDATQSVTGAERVTVGGNQAESVTGARTSQTVGARTITVGAMDEVGVTAKYALTAAGARTDDIAGLMNVVANKVMDAFNTTHERTVGGVFMITAGNAIADSAAGTKRETVGGAKVEIVTKSKGENIGVAKALTAGAVTVKTGGDIQCEAQGALAVTTGGAMSIKCGGDFTVAGKRVMITVGRATLEAGGKVTASPSQIAFDAGAVEGSGMEVELHGEVEMS